MKRKLYSPEFKAKVALEAAKSNLTANEIASKFEVHLGQVAQWKKELLEDMDGIFERKSGKKKPPEKGEEPAVLYKQIGRLKVEVDWLKKNLTSYPASDRKKFIDPRFDAISISRQCDLLGVCRTPIYYEPEKPQNKPLATKS